MSEPDEACSAPAAGVSLLMLASEFPPGPGGIGTHACQLATNLHARGWRVAVVTPQDYAAEGEIVTFNSQCVVPVTRLRQASPMFREAVYRWRVVSRQIQAARPSVLVASGSRAVWLAAPIAKRFDLPWIAIAHGTELGFRGWQRRVMKWTFEQATAVVAVSHYTREQMEVAGIRPRRVEVIPNGADEQQFRRLPAREVLSMRSRLGLEGARLLVTVGNVTERKGQEIVIRALPRVLREVPNAHYLMAGLPTRRAEMETLARQLGVVDHVHFLGRVAARELPVLLNASDLFVMTSRHTADGDFEGFGIAVVEAALCGVPAVVAAPSGLAEAIVDGQTGLAVPRDDVEATADAIASLLCDDRLRVRMGEAAMRRALAEQTWSSRVQAYEALLRDVCVRHANGAIAAH